MHLAPPSGNPSWVLVLRGLSETTGEDASDGGAHPRQRASRAQYCEICAFVCIHSCVCVCVCMYICVHMYTIYTCMQRILVKSACLLCWAQHNRHADFTSMHRFRTAVRNLCICVYSFVYVYVCVCEYIYTHVYIIYIYTCMQHILVKSACLSCLAVRNLCVCVCYPCMCVRVFIFIYTSYYICTNVKIEYI